MYLYLKGLWWESVGANGRESDWPGWVESQQVVEGGGIYKCVCGWDHYCVLSGCLLFSSLCSSGFQDLLRLNHPSLLMLCGCITETSAVRTKTPGSYQKEDI